MESDEKPFGIRICMPKNDPLTAAHLLGDDWAGYRWYRTEAERDAALVDMQDHPRYYRWGDRPSIRLEKVDRGRAR